MELQYKTVTITEEEYEDLLKDQRKLIALEAGGVDNWEGYDWAMETLEEEEG